MTIEDSRQELASILTTEANKYVDISSYEAGKYEYRLKTGMGDPLLIVERLVKILEEQQTKMTFSTLYDQIAWFPGLCVHLLNKVQERESNNVTILETREQLDNALGAGILIRTRYTEEDYYYFISRDQIVDYLIERIERGIAACSNLNIFFTEASKINPAINVDPKTFLAILNTMNEVMEHLEPTDEIVKNIAP